MTWSLPKNGKPGKWMQVTTPIQLCVSGLHLTTEPVLWYNPWRQQIYLVEVHKKAIRRWDYNNLGRTDKVAVSKCRLIRRLSSKEKQEVLWK